MSDGVTFPGSMDRRSAAPEAQASEMPNGLPFALTQHKVS
jgi:hypothetical protein